MILALYIAGLGTVAPLSAAWMCVNSPVTDGRDALIIVALSLAIAIAWPVVLAAVAIGYCWKFCGGWR